MMKIDIHSHIWEVNKHADAEFIADFGHSDASDPNALPENHWEDTAQYTDKTIVFGLKGKASGIDVPDEYISTYVAKHPDKLIGFMSIDPTVEGVETIEKGYYDLHLRGIKASPVRQKGDVGRQRARQQDLYQRCVLDSAQRRAVA